MGEGVEALMSPRKGPRPTLQVTVRGTCGHVWTLNTVATMAEITAKDRDGQGRWRVYCRECYAEGKVGGQKVRVTVMSRERCKCGTRLNSYNKSGECGACEHDRREADYRKAQEAISGDSRVPEC